jgi:transketolase
MGGDFSFVSVYVKHVVFNTDNSSFAAVVGHPVTRLECAVRCHTIKESTQLTYIYPRDSWIRRDRFTSSCGYSAKLDFSMEVLIYSSHGTDMIGLRLKK